jgi:hypothetical protein
MLRTSKTEKSKSCSLGWEASGALGVAGATFGADGGDLEGERGHSDPARMDDSPKGGTVDDARAGDVSAVNELKEDMVVVRGQEPVSAGFFSEPKTKCHRPLSYT